MLLYFIMLHPHILTLTLTLTLTLKLCSILWILIKLNQQHNHLEPFQLHFCQKKNYIFIFFSSCFAKSFYDKQRCSVMKYNNILSLQHFVHATICPCNDLSLQRFVLATNFLRPFVRNDLSATICPRRFVLQRFVHATFCPQRFVRNVLSCNVLS